MTNLQIGTILIAKYSLIKTTKGKEYKIIRLTDDNYGGYFINDKGKEEKIRKNSNRRLLHHQTLHANRLEREEDCSEVEELCRV